MGDSIISSGVAIAVAIIGLAILAVIVGRGSDTKNVVDSFGKFFSVIVGKAVAPVQG